MAQFVWTRLEGTFGWNAMAMLYALNNLDYHDFHGHVRRIYEWAQKLGVPYSRALDEAIAGHDCIMHVGVMNEYQSRVVSGIYFGDSIERDIFIMATKNHRPLIEGSVMAMLDLSDFLDDAQTRANTELLFAEAKRKAGEGFDYEKTRKGNIFYLQGVRANILEDLASKKPIEYREAWEGIEQGILKTITRLQTETIPV